MNKLGYCAMTLGNHEFDYGLEKLSALSKTANFPFLSLNFTDENRALIYEPYTIIESNGVKIAFIDIPTPWTTRTSTPAYFINEDGKFIYSFMQNKTGETLWKEVQENINKVRSDVDYVIALTHLGISSSTTSYTSYELIENTSGIDVVLDGHSQSILESEKVKNKEGNKVLLSSTGSNLENIGFLLIDQVGNISTSLINYYQEKDSDIASFIQKTNEEYNELLNTLTAKVKNDLIIDDPATGVRIIRMAETYLGNLCADAYRAPADA